jgi:RimJ/RimL family protein N-acetyltransferase
LIQSPQRHHGEYGAEQWDTEDGQRAGAVVDLARQVEVTALHRGYMLLKSEIETDRLCLTPITVEDATEMASVLADPSLHDFTGGAPETAEQLTVRYRRWVAGPSSPGQIWLNMIVRDRASRSAIGYVQATINPPSADIAWVIGKPWQRKGYATEAAGAMVEHLARVVHVQTLRALILPGHTASQVVASRLGLRCTDEVVDGEQVWLSST